MGICGSSPVVNRGELNLAELGSKAKSPEPRLELAEYKNVQAIDATVLGELYRAGLVNLSQKKEHCNFINVFPVPDADTGTNMYLALRGGVRGIDKAFDAKAGPAKVASDFIQGMLFDAQGNSGTCLTFFFSRLTKEIESKCSGKEELSVQDLAECLKAAGGEMNKAMEDPKPGTMLSVMKESTGKLAPGKSLQALFQDWLKHANVALKRTTDELVVGGVAVLKERNVVDSGAQGFCYFIEGVLLAMSGELKFGNYNDPGGQLSVVTAADNGFSAAQVDAIYGDHTNVGKFKYCTESVFMLKEGHTIDDVRAALGKHGDSIAAVEASRMVKVHVHANAPDSVFKSLEAYSQGPLLKIKAEDMRNQVLNEKRILPNSDKATVQVVYTTLDNEPNYITKVAQPWAVPMRLVVDGECFLSRSEMPQIKMANITRLEDFKTFTTAGPSMMSFKQTIQRALANKKEVLLMLPPRHLSAGSVHAAEQAVHELSPENQKRITYWHSCYGMGVGGSNVAIAFEAAALGMSAEEIVKVLHREQDKYKYVVTQLSIKGLLRSGRVPVVKCTDRMILPLARDLEVKVVAYMPYPVPEAKKHPELIQRAKEGGFDWITAPVKHGLAGLSWDSAHRYIINLYKTKIPPGTEVRVLITTACCQWMAEGLYKLISDTYKVRFFDFCELDSTLIGSSFFGTVHTLIVPVNNESIRLGRLPGAEKK